MTGISTTTAGIAPTASSHGREHVFASLLTVVQLDAEPQLVQPFIAQTFEQLAVERIARGVDADMRTGVEPLRLPKKR